MNDGENNVTTSQETRYAEVSLRAVELLAKAQRAADEAVAEAQSYARDLEKSAREQYKEILQRAQSAAQQVATAEGARVDHAAVSGGAGSVDAQQLAYVRTYARVAHTQLKSVLAALNEELDQLAVMAERSVHSASVPSVQSVPSVPSVPSPPEPYPTPDEATGPHGPSEVLAHVASEPPSSVEPTWQPSQLVAPDQKPTETDGAAMWPPIATASSSISYFHHGSSWDGPY